MSSSCYQFWGDVLLFRVGIIFWVWLLPSNSHHQHCYIFSNKSLPKPSFPTIASWEGVPHTPRYVLFLFIHHSLPSSFPLVTRGFTISNFTSCWYLKRGAVGRPTETPWRRRPNAAGQLHSWIPLSSLPWTTHDPGFETLHEPRPSKVWALGTLKTVTSLATQNANWVEDDMMLYIGPKRQNTGENDEG